MPVACLLVIAALAAAQPLPASHGAAIGVTPTTADTTARLATLAMRSADRPRQGAEAVRHRSDRARLNTDPPRLASGYRVAQLDLRWHAADVTEPYPR
jgi:hypothetical protein